MGFAGKAALLCGFSQVLAALLETLESNLRRRFPVRGRAGRCQGLPSPSWTKGGSRAGEPLFCIPPPHYFYPHYDIEADGAAKRASYLRICPFEASPNVSWIHGHSQPLRMGVGVPTLSAVIWHFKLRISAASSLTFI